MNASLKCRYDVDKNAAAAIVGVSVGDLKIRASLTDATIVNGPSLSGLALAVEKPGSFIVDYYVPKQDYRFQFMSKVNVFSKPLNLTYIHSRGQNQTILNGNLVFDQANKVSANYAMGLGNCKLKYTYVHKEKTTFEPSYDVSRSAWDFSISRKVYDDDNDVIKAIYNPSSKALAMEWSRRSKANHSFKITASINMDDEVRKPKVIAETTLEF